MTAREDVASLFDCDNVLFDSHLSLFSHQSILHG